MNYIDVVWWSLGGITASVGLVVLARALFADRARGRRRCPKCWYDLTQSPTPRCSECGHRSKRPSQMLRTRRHWRAAIVGLLLVVASVGGLTGWQIRKHGNWIAAAPTVGYIAFLPRLDGQTTFAELQRRVNEGELRQWQYWLLVTRCIGLLRNTDRDDKQLIEITRLLMNVEPFEYGRMTHAERQPWKSWSAVSEINPDGAVEVLANLIEHPNPRVQIAALEGLMQLGGASKRAMPLIVSKLVDADPDVRRSAQNTCALVTKDLFGRGYTFIGAPNMGAEGDWYHRLAGCGTDDRCALPILLEGLEGETQQMRTLAMLAGKVLFHNDVAWQNRILEIADDPDSELRHSAVMATALLPLDDRVQRIVREALADNEPRNDRRGTGMQAIQHRGPEAAMFLPDVEEILHNSEDDRVLAQAIECYLRIGGDPAVVMETLAMWIDDPFERQGEHQGGWEHRVARAFEALAERGPMPEEIKCIVREYLNHASFSLRGAAAHCYAAIGGDRRDATQVALHILTARRDNRAARKMARDDLLDVSMVSELLHSPDFRDQTYAVQLLHEIGASAASELPALRALAAMGDTRAEEAVRRIEYILKQNEER